MQSTECCTKSLTLILWQNHLHVCLTMWSRELMNMFRTMQGNFMFNEIRNTTFSVLVRFYMDHSVCQYNMNLHHKFLTHW